MGRLTERNLVWIDDEFWTAAREPDDDEITDVYLKLREYENTGLTPAEVAELAQAEADGRLVALPCNVGDTIWYIDASIEPNDRGKWIIRYRIKAIKFDYSVMDWIDTPLYLTQDEAQAALDRMEVSE